MLTKSIEGSTVIQKYGSLAPVQIGLSTEVRHRSVAALNRLLAHSMALRDLYKKAHWQTSGANFYELHLLFDKHYEQQLSVIDQIAERVQTLGGVSLALAHDVVEESRISRAPRGREDPLHQLHRLLDAHLMLLSELRPLARQATDDGDDGTNDLMVSNVLRTNELQSWFVGEHLAVAGPSVFTSAD